MMKYLQQGQENAERLAILFSFTHIESEDIKAAIFDHLVEGINITTACALNTVHNGNFTRAVKRLEIAAAGVERIKEIDYAHLK